MVPSNHSSKNRFKQIFADGWEAFKRNHPRYEAMDEVVQKMLGCGDPANGHAVYLCPDCQERRVVAFSCKSQFCLSCAKVYGQHWVVTVQAMLHPGVTYRHLILTVPDALRTLIYQHAARLLDGLMQAAQRAMDAVVAQTKRQAIRLGYIVVLQTAGRSASYNPHLHVLMTDGGLRADGRWQRLGYLPYDLLHRRWQTQVLELLRTQLAGNARAQAVAAEMRRRYPKGFVAHLQGNVLPRMRQLTRYLVCVKWSARPWPCPELSRMIGSRAPSRKGIVISSVRARKRWRRSVGRPSLGAWCNTSCRRGESASATMACKRGAP